jgi:hypothetical protein
MTRLSHIVRCEREILVSTDVSTGTRVPIQSLPSVRGGRFGRGGEA